MPLALVMAAYLVWAGSDFPGGAFQAGTVLAGGLIIAAIGGAVAWPRADNSILRAVLVLGPGVFLIIGLAGIALGQIPVLSARLREGHDRRDRVKPCAVDRRDPRAATGGSVGSAGS